MTTSKIFQPMFRLNKISKIIIVLLTSFELISCQSQCQESSKKFIDKTIDFILANKDGNTIELPFIYDSLFSVIPEDSTEKLLLAEALKKRGFKVVNWGRGNYPPLGPRIVTLTLQKDNCLCEVDKIYYSTINDSLYEATERISCKNKNPAFEKRD